VRLLWQAWNAYLRRASGYQAVALLNALYFGVFGPSVLVARLFGARLLDLNSRRHESYWLERRPVSTSLVDLSRHF
jgi:hypothetical protein